VFEVRNLPVLKKARGTRGGEGRRPAYQGWGRRKASVPEVGELPVLGKVSVADIGNFPELKKASLAEVGTKEGERYQR
jgi:hypothetical protein